MGDLTRLISEVRQGSDVALGELYERLYDDLHRIAHAKLRQTDSPTLLDTTGLLNESYLRLVRLGELQVTDRKHFLAYAARVMRSIVVDLARSRLADRRGGAAEQVTLDTTLAEKLSLDDTALVRVHDALEALAKVDERLVQVVQMRFFAGLDAQEIADALGVGVRTVERDWEKARAYLYALLK